MSSGEFSSQDVANTQRALATLGDKEAGYKGNSVTAEMSYVNVLAGVQQRVAWHPSSQHVTLLHSQHVKALQRVSKKKKSAPSSRSLDVLLSLSGLFSELHE